MKKIIRRIKYFLKRVVRSYRYFKYANRSDMRCPDCNESIFRGDMHMEKYDGKKEMPKLIISCSNCGAVLPNIRFMSLLITLAVYDHGYPPRHTGVYSYDYDWHKEELKEKP